MNDSMTVAAARREVRAVFVGGWLGQAVSGSIWLLGFAGSTGFSTGAWLTGVTLLAFGAWARSAWKAELSRAAAARR